MLLLQARQVLNQAAALAAQAAAIANGIEPALTLAVDNLFPSQPLLGSLHALSRAFPLLQVTLFTEAIGAAERRLRDGTAQLALCGITLGGADDIVSWPVSSIDMVPVAAASHPLAAETPPIARQTLEQHVQLILTDPFGADGGPNRGVISPLVWRFVDLGRRLDFVVAGFGWANMPGHLVDPLIARGTLARLDLAEPDSLLRRIPMHALHRRNAPPGPAGRWFLDHLQQGGSAFPTPAAPR